MSDETEPQANVQPFLYHIEVESLSSYFPNQSLEIKFQQVNNIIMISRANLIL